MQDKELRCIGCHANLTYSLLRIWKKPAKDKTLAGFFDFLFHSYLFDAPNFGGLSILWGFSIT